MGIDFIMDHYLALLFPDGRAALAMMMLQANPALAGG